MDTSQKRYMDVKSAGTEHQSLQKLELKPQCCINTHPLEWHFFFPNVNTKMLENSLATSYEAKHLLTT